MSAIDTSAAAYADIKPKAPSIRERVLQIITDQNGRGISRTEIAKALGINEITSGSRITELLQAGKIRRKGETVLSTSGKQEHLYVLGSGVPLAVKQNKLDSNRMAEVLKAFGITADTLMGGQNPAIMWDQSPEGFDFWDRVHNTLQG